MRLKRYIYLYIVALLCLSPFYVSAQEGRYGAYFVELPPSDLQRQGIKGNVRKVISYEGMAKRTAQGVIFSEDPLKIVTTYNTQGNITSQETYRNGSIIETTTYTYSSNGTKQSMRTSQSNGIVSITIRYFHDQKSLLTTQTNNYNYAGKLTQTTKYTYDHNKNILSQIDYSPTGAKTERLLCTYNENNQLDEEREYHYLRNDSVLYYSVKYEYNARGNVRMHTQRLLTNNGTYDQRIQHYRYYQYDKDGNWHVCCHYRNALATDNRLVPKTIVVREIEYY